MYAVLCYNSQDIVLLENSSRSEQLHKCNFEKEIISQCINREWLSIKVFGERENRPQLYQLLRIYPLTCEVKKT